VVNHCESLEIIYPNNRQKDENFNLKTFLLTISFFCYEEHFCHHWPLILLVQNLRISAQKFHNSIKVLALFAGYSAYAYFENCDPIAATWVDKRDQILPYLSLYIFGDIAPGVAGIYLRGVNNAFIDDSIRSLFFRLGDAKCKNI
jgi:hypothetical protein